MVINFIQSAPPLFAESGGSGKKKPLEAQMGEALGNFIAIGTGQVKHGERIPLPKFKDGTFATRDDAHYLVSPAEISTAITYARTQASQGVVQQEEVRPQTITETGEVITARDSIKMNVFKLTQPTRASFQGAVFFIKCDVDEKGYAEVSLWKHGWAGRDFAVSEDNSYDELQKYYKERGITSATVGELDPQAALMNRIRDRARVNYMVIATRSSI